MLKRLHVKHVTVFAEATFDFGQQLNLFVGVNGSGKTHVMKAAYSVLAVGASGAKDSGGGDPTKSYFQTALATKLRNVFKPDTIGRLARRQAGRNRSEIAAFFADQRFDLSCSFNASSKSEVVIERTPTAWLGAAPIYLPTRELLSIFPGFVSLYETTHLQFEETWRDTAIFLGAPLAKGRTKAMRELLQPLEAAMGGDVELDQAGRFYLNLASGKVEMHLVAEGVRKLAMLARLIATGTLRDQGYLFWDEPEANLNPKLIKAVAKTILQLAQSGIQVFIATHSLFLLRELYLLQKQAEHPFDARCFGLQLGQANEVMVLQGATIDDIGDISALDEALAQADRYLDSEYQASVS